jgi:hypothetical protein
MKVRIVIFIALIIQICFALFTLIFAPEPSGSITVGLEHLKAAAPSEAPTGAKTVEGYSILKTSGDFFVAALQKYWLQIKATLLAVALNILVLLWLLLFIRKEKKVPKPDILHTN